jgi:hypothetical protein
MTMTAKKVDNSFTGLVGICHPVKSACKILEYEIQGVHNTWAPKDVLVNLKKMFQICYLSTKICFYGKVRNK